MHFTAPLTAIFLSSAVLVAAQYSGYGRGSAIYARDADYHEARGIYARALDIEEFLFRRGVLDEFELLAARDAEADADAEEDDYLESLMTRSPGGGKGHGPGSIVEAAIGTKNKFDEYKDSKAAQAVRNDGKKPLFDKIKPLADSAKYVPSKPKPLSKDSPFKWQGY